MKDIVYCEAYYEELTEHNPEELVRLCESDILGQAKLTFALEHLKYIPTQSAFSVLEERLQDDSPLVREGAVYGLHGHKGAQIVLEKRLEIEENKGVREAIEEFLDYEED